MDELSAMGPEGIMKNARKVWTRTAPADLYYNRDESNPKIMRGTPKLHELCELFKKVLLNRAAAARALQVYLFSSNIIYVENFCIFKNIFNLLLYSLLMNHPQEKLEPVYAGTNLKLVVALLLTVIVQWMKMTEQWKN